MNIDEKFNINVEKLKKSPVFAMSLGSKELFHSNFWAYLIEQKETRELIKCFFPDFEIEMYDRVGREDNNRDLTIYDKNGNEYVIENKIKSYPRLEQLEGYEKGKFRSGVITGINEPPFKLQNWRFVSYHMISESLKQINSKISGYYCDLINDYCDVLDSINELLNLSLKETEGRLSYWSENINKLYEIRIMDVFRKNKADDFVVNGFGDLKPVYENMASSKPGIRFFVERSFNNGKATLSFVFRKYAIEDVNFDESTETIGIQIEDNQFRFFKWNGELSADECFEKYSALGWFDNSFNKKTKRLIKGFKTKMSKKYCQYGSNWIYQYFDTWYENGQNLQNYSDLNQLLTQYLDLAFEIISK